MRHVTFFQHTSWQVFQCGFLLLNMLAVDSLHTQAYAGQNGNRLWQRSIYEGLTFETQCEQSRDPNSGAPTNELFWKMVEQHGVELNPMVKELLNQMLDVQPEKRIRMDEVEQKQILKLQTTKIEAQHEMKERL